VSSGSVIDGRKHLEEKGSSKKALRIKSWKKVHVFSVAH